MKSTMGRPRQVTDEQIAKILAWHDDIEAWKAKRQSIPTQRELAQALQLSPGTITYVVRNRGILKQPSPEERDVERERRQRRLQPPRAPGAR